jgi:hypothetical protein
MARDIIGGNKKVVAKVVKPKVVKQPIVPAVNDVKFNQAYLNDVNKTRREADAQALADQITNTWTMPKFDVSSNGPSAASLARQNTMADRANVNSLLSGYKSTAESALADRYKNYLAALNTSNQTATGTIDTATKNLLASLPTTYKPAVTPSWLQPQAAQNPYQQYLANTGASTADIANLQNYANSAAQQATNMYTGINQSQNDIQQNYLDSLRAGANAQGTAAKTALATQLAGAQNAAGSTYGTAQGNILQTLLPMLVANPIKSSANIFKPKKVPKQKGKK